MLRLPICSIGGSERKNKCDLLQPTSHNADELIPLLDGLAVAVQLQLWRFHVVQMRELLQARMKKAAGDVKRHDARTEGKEVEEWRQR